MPNDLNPGFSGPLFIVGMPRSGTKILREVLLTNPRIRIPHTETELLPQLAEYVKSKGGLLASREDFQGLHAWAQGFQYFKYAQKRGDQITPDQWYSACREFTTAGIFEGLIRHDVSAEGDHHVIWGDKSPSYINCLALILQLFPQARIVHIVRDVRDQVLSSNRAWGKDILRAAQRWNDDVGRAMRFCKTIGDRCLVVRYEDLVGGSPETVVKQLCEFLNLDYQESMLTLKRPAEKGGVGQGQRKIVQGNTKKYLTGLSPDDLRDVERIAGETMAELGYVQSAPRTPMRLSRLSLASRKLKDAMYLVKKRKGETRESWMSAVRFYLRSG